MRLIPWRGLALVLAGVCLLLGTMVYSKSAECVRLSARCEALYRQAKALESTSPASRPQEDSLRARLAGLKPSPIHERYVARFRERGLKHPIQDLTTDLQRHPELIPHPGVSGGRMGFYDTDRIRVLNDSWVYATFEDGHVGGDAILGYDVAPGGKIIWHVVLSRRL